MGAALAAVACSASSRTDDTAESSGAIVGGIDANSASLNAVGALLLTQGDSTDMFCTGTLISPRAVLTAKHCGVQTDQVQDDAGAVQTVETRFVDAAKVSFAIGPDKSHPTKVVEAESVELCNLYQGGVSTLGCDTAIYYLKEPITDIKPLKVAPGPLAADSIGKRMVAIGYGRTSQTDATKYGTRKLGNVTVRAVTGPFLSSVYPTVDQFLDAERADEGNAYVTAADAVLRQFYPTPLLDQYEAYAGNADGDVQVCSGDSGGPLLEKVDGELVVRGVASTVMSGVRLPCKMGVIYATFGPKAQDILKNAINDPCQGVPPEGRCDGDVAVRCTRVDEGPRRLVKVDCAAALQKCVPPSAGEAGVHAGDAGDAGDATVRQSTTEVSCGD